MYILIQMYALFIYIQVFADLFVNSLSFGLLVSCLFAYFVCLFCSSCCLLVLYFLLFMMGA